MEGTNLNKARDIINSIYEHGRDEIIPHLRGSAGIGKTSIIYDIAKEHNANVVELICSQITYTELSGMPMPLEDSKTMDIYDNQKLLDLKDGDILFLDEFDKSDITVRQAILKLLNERTLMSGKKLPDILIVAASNRTEEATNVDDCVRDRFFYIEVTFSEEQWCKYIKDKYGITANDLVGALDVRDETDVWNTLTPRTAEKIINYYSKACTAGCQDIAEDTLWAMDYPSLFINELKAQFNSLKERLDILNKLKKSKDKDIIALADELANKRIHEWYSIIDKHLKAEAITKLLD